MSAADELRTVMTLRSIRPGDALLNMTFTITDPSGMACEREVVFLYPNTVPGAFIARVKARLFVTPPPEPPKSMREQLFDLLRTTELVDQVLSIAGIADDEDEDVYEHDPDWYKE